jgi:glycerophosphoryl diester phosphodiesterase
MTRRSFVLVIAIAGGCANAGPSGSPDLASAIVAGPQVDAGMADLATAASDAAVAGDLAAHGSYNTSLSSCWTNASCTRALLIAHGGAWSLADPAYGTTAAYDAALAGGADAIKADVRFSKDGVPVVVHSSPFQSYEIDPLDFSCLGATVENMNVSDIVACRWINGDHIQRLDALLDWARGKMVVMLTVKVLSTTPQTIAQIIASNATDYAFVEIDVATMTTIVPMATGKDQVYYLVEAGSPADVTTLLGLHDPRLFMIEDANADGFGGLGTVALTSLVTTQLHPAGVRAFSSIASVSASAQDHENLWNEGFDVVMTNSFSAGHDGRVAINTMRGLSPP